MAVDVEIANCGPKGAAVITVHFPYSKNDVEAMRGVGGRRWAKEHRHWHAPLDMQACRELRVAFRDRLLIGPELRSWAFTQGARERTLGTLAATDTATLSRLPTVLPSLYAAVHLGPLGKHMTAEERAAGMLAPASYQAADTAFIANSNCPLIGNEQGTGKTLEWIAGVWEAGLEKGNHLVVCPKVAIDGTWEGELATWQKDAIGVEIFTCLDNRESRESTLSRFAASTAPVKWVVVNPAMLTWEKDPTRQGKHTVAVTATRKQMDACYCKAAKGAHEHYVEPYPLLYATTWRTLCVDECHKGMIRNRQSLTAKSMKKLKCDGKRSAMSGTPMKKLGGADLWGVLNWLNPKVFSSYWRFVGNYFEVSEDEYGKKVGKLLDDRKEAFYAMLQPYMLRRLKSEVAPWLPPKHYIIQDCFMGAEQAKQYRAMEEGEAVDLDGVDLTPKGVLDRFVRLKQYANALCTIDKVTGEIVPKESNKVEHLLQNMDDAGVFEPDSTIKQLVFSQSKRMVMFIADILRKKGVRVAVISGDRNKPGERKQLMKDFQEGDLQVLVIVTTAGGVSLTLDAADTVHLIDEMWSPDEDAQAEDRAHRVSRIHQVTVYIYRSIDTIDQYIADTKEEKAITHSEIMDVRRRVLARNAN